jgi:hypothetical protein
MIDQYPPSNGVLTSLIWRKTAVGGETSLSGYDNSSQALSYTPGQEQVYLNGILLVRGDDYTATNGTSITGLAALSANDFIQINCYNNFSLATLPTSGLTGTISNAQLQNSSITINESAVSLGGSVSGLATLSSPTFTGTPLAPTASAGTNTTQIATTQFVRTEVSNLIASAPSALDTLNELSAALGNDANFSTTITNSLAAKASLTGSETLTNKTLTAPVINNGTASNIVLIAPEERVNVVASAATGTINFDILTAGVWYYTSNATADHTLNFRGNGSNTLNSILAVGDSITVAWFNTNGTTAYRPTVFQIDGSAVTPKWQGGTAPSSGNTSSVDIYTFNIVKTASATFTVFASQTKFA